MKVFCANIEPKGKPRMVRSDRWRHRPSVDRFWEWKDELRKIASYQLFNHYLSQVDLNNGGWKQDDSPAHPEEFDRLICMFLIPMPKSWSKKAKRAHFLKPHHNKPDIDNLQKAVLDALWRRDEFLSEIISVKYWAYTPMILLIGIEQDEQMHIQWESGRYPKLSGFGQRNQCRIIFPGCEEEEGQTADLGEVQILWGHSGNYPRLLWERELPHSRGCGILSGTIREQGGGEEDLGRLHRTQGGVDTQDEELPF